MLSFDEISRNVMPSGTARVTGHGIYFGGGYYSCQTALRDDWFSKARVKPWNVDVSYDPRNLGILYLQDSGLQKGYEPCRLLDKSTDLMGVSLFEIKELDLDKKRTQVKGENDRQAKRILRDKQMEEIKNKATKATKAVADPNASKSERTADINSNRAEEKCYQRSLESFDLTGTQQLDDTNDTTKSDVITSDYIDNEFAELMTSRRQREGK